MESHIRAVPRTARSWYVSTNERQVVGPRDPMDSFSCGFRAIRERETQGEDYALRAPTASDAFGAGSLAPAATNRMQTRNLGATERGGETAACC
jgi:hypothetical protein